MSPSGRGAPMRLAELLAEVSGVRVTGDPEVEIVEVRDDSREIEPGDLFVALPGNAVDGRRFVADAIARGARAVLMQEPLEAAGEASSARPGAAAVTRVAVDDARLALARIAARRWPSSTELGLSAVTGTNGKTTTTYLVEAMLAAAGIRCGIIGTVAYRLSVGGPVGGSVADPVAEAGPREAQAAAPFFRDAPLTTPGALTLHRLLAEMRAAGATDVVLEASSHALVQRRLDGCQFRVAALTNLTQDHLDYHGTMAEYFDAKALLFERLLDPARGVAVLPVDLPEGRAMRARLRPRQPVLGVAFSAASSPGSGADVQVESARLTAQGLRARLRTPLGPIDLDSPLVGEFNLANIVLAVGMAIARGGISAEAIARGVEALAGVPGRLQRVDNARGVLAVVDYAHTPDALERATSALRPLVAPGGRLITVFGCGGDRDRRKRPLMGRAAVEGSDLAVVTSDNPRSEDPNAIIDGIVAGGADVAGPAVAPEALAGAMRGFCVEPDRRAAIRLAVAATRPGDVLLLAGKGHESTQLIGKARLHFDDLEEARLAFAETPSPAGAQAPNAGRGGEP